jgi:3-deoxy-7-phosphoheptulonate synthase
MIVVLKKEISRNHFAIIKDYIENRGFRIVQHKGVTCRIVEIIGNTEIIDPKEIKIFEGVHGVIRIREPYLLASKKSQNKTSVIRVKDVEIGGNAIQIMAGPCAVENEKQIYTIAQNLNKLGIKILRGGAFKPRSSPYFFQGLEEKGLKLIRAAADEYKMTVVSEILDTKYLSLMEKYVDILQIGSRNMYNYALLKEVGKITKPVLLKRAWSATIEELLMSAEYIISSGNKNVVLCERGIRTFEQSLRNTLDLSAVPVIKSRTHLPVIVDPSHATGFHEIAVPMAESAIVAGADGLLIEVHDRPARALSDGIQSLDLRTFKSLLKRLHEISKFMGRDF